MDAVGIHVFAGGFTMGVRRIFDVKEQLEIHNFGRETCEERLDLQFTNCESWDKWPRCNVAFAYGNPRCTGFSCITAGYDAGTHGPWSAPTQDIWDFCRYVVSCDIPIAIWESVQQAFSVGRPLLDALRDDIFVPAGYRIAHVLLNYASFGNAQQRRRYFFVAYKGGNFNIQPPELGEHLPTTYDAIWDLRDRETRPIKGSSLEYDHDCFYNLTPEEWADVRLIPPCHGLNGVGRFMHDRMCDKHRTTWITRSSDMPYSMHCPTRQWWTKPFSTIHSSASRFLHPDLHRPVTVGELARVMGWGSTIPAGKRPIAQIAKGVVPEAGEWLALQARLFLENHWGSDDYCSKYDASQGRWVGRDTHGEPEKVFNLTQFYQHDLKLERYPDECFRYFDRHSVEPLSGRLLDPWSSDPWYSRTDGLSHCPEGSKP